MSLRKLEYILNKFKPKNIKIGQLWFSETFGLIEIVGQNTWIPDLARWNVYIYNDYRILDTDYIFKLTYIGEV